MIKTKIEITQSSASKLWYWVISREVSTDNSSYYTEIARSRGYVEEKACQTNLNYISEAFRNEIAEGTDE